MEATIMGHVGIISCQNTDYRSKSKTCDGSQSYGYGDIDIWGLTNQLSTAFGAFSLHDQAVATRERMGPS